MYSRYYYLVWQQQMGIFGVVGQVEDFLCVLVVQG